MIQFDLDESSDFSVTAFTIPKIKKQNIVLQRELDSTKFSTHAKPDMRVLKVKHRMIGMKSSVLPWCPWFKPLQPPRQSTASEVLTPGLEQTRASYSFYLILGTPVSCKTPPHH